MKKLLHKTILTGICVLGAVFGVLVIYRGLFNSSFEFIANKLAEKGICAETRNPTTCPLLNLYVGMTLIAVSVCLMLYSSNQQVINSFLNVNYKKILSFIIGFACLLVLLISVNKSFNADEYEHIHSAWYIMNGFTPYTDFFEHHHPLMWYLFVPPLLILGYNVKVIVILRIVFFALTLSIAFVTYLIAKKSTGSKETGLFSAVLLLFMVMFIGTSVEIRPDVPQVLCGLLSVYYMISFLQTGDNRNVILAGLFASISFLFLQKALFLLIAYGAVFIYGLVKRMISVKSIFYFTVCFSPAIFFLMLYLFLSHSFEDYMLTNWLLNMSRRSWTFSAIKPSLDDSGIFWLLAAISIPFSLINRNASRELKVVSFIGLVTLVLTFIAGRPHQHYFMLPVALTCIGISYFLKFHFDKFKVQKINRLVLIMIIVFIPTFFLIKLGLPENRSELKKINYVLQNTKETDLVYDGRPSFNMFRPDLHYFWFSTSKGECMDTYNKITNNKYGDYDICELIKIKRPKLISGHGLDIHKYGLTKLYEKTEFDELYIRIGN